MLSDSPYLFVMIVLAMGTIGFAAARRTTLGISCLIAFLPLFALGRRCFSENAMPFITFETLSVFIIWLIDRSKRATQRAANNRSHYAITLAIFCFLFAGVISSILSQDALLSFRILLVGGVAPLLVFTLIRNSTLNDRDVRLLVFGIIAACALTSAYGISRYGVVKSASVGLTDEDLMSDAYNVSTILNLFGPPSASMGMIVASIPLAISLAVQGGRLNVAVGIVSLMLAAIASVLSVSRGSWLGAVVALLACLALFRRKLRIWIVVVVLVLNGLYGSVAFDFILSAGRTRLHGSGGFESTVRLENNALALESATRFWWHGLGLGRYADVYAYFPDSVAAAIQPLWFAHSLFLTLIPEIGFIGALGFFGLFAVVIVRALRSRNRMGPVAITVYSCVAGILAYVTVASTAGCYLISYLAWPIDETYFMCPTLIVIFAMLGLVDNLSHVDMTFTR